MPGLTTDEIDGIAEQMTQKLIDANRAAWVDPETHSKHHRWAARKMQDEEEVQQMRRKVLTSTLMWAAPLALIWLSGAVLKDFAKAIGRILGIGD